MSKELEHPQPIPVAWVTKEDLLYCRPDLEAQIEALSAGDMAYLADKIGDAFQVTYQLVIDVVLDEYFKDTDQHPPANGT